MKNKSCCGCFGGVFRTNLPKPKMVENFAQTDSPAIFSSKVIPSKDFKAFTDNHFFQRPQTSELPGVPKFRTTIITGRNISSTFYNESVENSVRTPIVHNYEPDSVPANNVPQIFDNLKNKKSTNGLPMLVPITPARPFRVGSLTHRKIVSPQ